jgi:hypothetical protein
MRKVANKINDGIGYEDVNWIRLAQVMMLCCCEHGNETSGFVRGGELIDQASEL